MENEKKEFYTSKEMLGKLWIYGDTYMQIGLKRGTVLVEPHRIEWEIAAQEIISSLRKILKDDMIDAQHIGSTAIKNICAKPIVDIVVGVNNYSVKYIAEKPEIPIIKEATLREMNDTILIVTHSGVIKKTQNKCSILFCTFFLYRGILCLVSILDIGIVQMGD